LGGMPGDGSTALCVIWFGARHVVLCAISFPSQHSSLVLIVCWATCTTTALCVSERWTTTGSCALATRTPHIPAYYYRLAAEKKKKKTKKRCGRRCDFTLRIPGILTWFGRYGGYPAQTAGDSSRRAADVGVSLLWFAGDQLPTTATPRVPVPRAPAGVHTGAANGFGSNST